MSNLQKQNELSKRKFVLHQRYERLLELNRTHDYVRNEKHDKYIALLIEIKKQKAVLDLKYRELNQVYNQQVNDGIKALTSLTREHLFKLTNPN